MSRSAAVPVRRAAGRFVVMGMMFLQVGMQALWAPMTLEQLVKQSELIVIGELVSIRNANASVDIGTIRIDEVLRPGRTKTPSVSLSLPVRRQLAPSSAVFYNVGQRGIWFLRRDAGAKDPLYFADHPHRFRSIDDAANVRAYIKTLGR